MSFVPDDSQDQLVASVRRFVSDRLPNAAVRSLIATPDAFDSAAWQMLSTQLGVIGLAVPEEYGGGSFSWIEQALVFEEMGRGLVCLPYFSTVALAIPALLAAQDDAAAKEWLPAIVGGTTRATVAVTEPDGRWDLDGLTTTAQRDDGGFLLTGTKSFVIDGASADLLLVVARTVSGPSLFAVDPAASGVERMPMTTLDLTRKQAQITLEGAPGRLVGAEGGAGAVIDQARDVALVALAMEQVGGAQRCLDMSVEYAKVRVQFGRKIGSFQAIKHKCADMLVAVESARSTAYHAAWTAVHAPAELPVAAAMAKAVASEAFVFCAGENIQIHGGIGFTWEHDAHLYYRRAHSSAVMFGDAAYHRERLAQLLDFSAANA
jgi:alkylation response protein AidB-like acyl-CoA dehydrogenase